jgi:hypothetical protein
MFSKPSTHRFELSRLLPQPVALTPAETNRVSGGGSNVQHGNPGGGPASYNTPGNPDYGQTRPTVSPGDGPDLE